jgi:phage protein D
MNIANLTTTQLNQIIAIKEQIEALQSQIDSIAADGGEVPTPPAQEPPATSKRKYRMTAAHRRKLVKALARARSIRWAKFKAQSSASEPAKKKDRRSSPAVRAKLAAAARARWAKVRAEAKKTL